MCPFCHFELSQKGEKSTKIKRKLTILGYFAIAQYDSKRVIASRFCENGVAIHKFGVIFTFWIATLALLARNDGGFYHFERSEKSKEFKICFIYGYFANAQYDKIYDAKSVWYDKFGLLLKNNGYFHSNFRDKIYKFYSFLWIATLALLARNDGKAQIQIFHSKFKAFHKFYSKFNSFYKFISNFKPYTRLFHIFTPNFRAVFTDKFSRKEELWQQLAQKAGQEQSRRLKATENAAKPTK